MGFPSIEHLRRSAWTAKEVDQPGISHEVVELQAGLGETRQGQCSHEVRNRQALVGVLCLESRLLGKEVF